MKKTIGDQLENLPSGLSMSLKLSVKANRGPVAGAKSAKQKSPQSEGILGWNILRALSLCGKKYLCFFFWKHSDNSW